MGKATKPSITVYEYTASKSISMDIHLAGVEILQYATWGNPVRLLAAYASAMAIIEKMRVEMPSFVHFDTVLRDNSLIFLVSRIMEAQSKVMIKMNNGSYIWNDLSLYLFYVKQLCLSAWSQEELDSRVTRQEKAGIFG